METRYSRVKAFRGNYVKADYNFVIQNLPYGSKADREDNPYYGSICVLQNIISRGAPSIPSQYLSSRYSISNPHEKFKKDQNNIKKYSFLSLKTPKYRQTILGHDESNHYPAERFFYEELSRIEDEFPGILQLFQPEVYIDDIVESSRSAFTKQRVDFYCDIARLVIEVDGPQHLEEGQALLDQSRDQYLKKHGVETIRIKTSDLNGHTAAFENAMERIAAHIAKKSLYHFYKKKERWMTYTDEDSDPKTEEIVRLTAVFRFQIMILELLKCGKLSLDDPIWNISVREHDVKGFEEDAVLDILLWLRYLLSLRGITLEEPKLNIVCIEPDQSHGKNTDFIHVDVDTISTWDDAYLEESKTIFVRNAHFQIRNYYRVSKADPIKYDFLNEFRFRNSVHQVPDGLLFVLKNIYGFDSFREGQAEIIISALCMKDTIGLLPTGSGKSLCYQICVFLQPCSSICVFPIKALMNDQQDNLQSIGVKRAGVINSDITGEDRTVLQDSFASGGYQMLFVSPERFQSPSFRNDLQSLNQQSRLQVAYAVIDEAHCLSEWGHSFRTSYLNLAKTIRKYCPSAVLFGLTATASVNTLKNIQVEFGITDRNQVVTCGKYTRDELQFDVVSCSSNDKYNKLIHRLKKYQKMQDVFVPRGKESHCGLIFTPYVNGKDGCFQLSERLSIEFQNYIAWYSGSKPDKYYSDEPLDDYKNRIQKEYKRNLFTCMTATKAFGMGVDKPNICYTVHYGLPSSLEALYQEAGRAGRDKGWFQENHMKAACTVLVEPELADNEQDLARVFQPDTTVDELKAICERACPPSYRDENGFKVYPEWTGKDIYKQLKLLIGGLNKKEEELSLARAILKKRDEKGLEQVLLQPGKLQYDSDEGIRRPSCQMVEKCLYHLSLIGAVSDWTMEGMRDSQAKIRVDYTGNSEREIKEHLLNAIRSYEPDFSLEPIQIRKAYMKYAEEWNNSPELAEYRAFSIYWTWYYSNIIYSRIQALKVVSDLCSNFRPEDAEAFKNEMESYFKYDTVTDIYENIGSDAWNVDRWFEILDEKYVKAQGVRGLIMQLSRFLESTQNNVGFNYISGLLRIIDGSYDDMDGQNRLKKAVQELRSHEATKGESTLWKIVLSRTAQSMGRLLTEKAEYSEQLSSVFIEVIDEPDVAQFTYETLADNYSLQIIVKSALAQIYQTGLETALW